MNIIKRIKLAIVTAIENRIEIEVENIMAICVEAGADIQSSIENAFNS